MFAASRGSSSAISRSRISTENSGTNDDPGLIAGNVSAMTDAALQLFRAGHLPVLGEWYALPLIERALAEIPGAG
jgi:hypothetical protein